MTDRAERIERIRELLEDRRHPGRRVGILSAANLTRVILRFGAMALAAILVQRILGSGVVGAVVAAIAVGAADAGVARLWKQIGRQVQQAWTVVGIAAVLLMIAAMLIMKSSPATRDAAGGWWNNWLASKQAALDNHQRARRIMVDSAAATDPHWRMLLDSGALKLGTYEEAFKWCSELGAGWTLPSGMDNWPRLDRYPNLGTSLYAWAFGHRGIQIGDGKAPAVMVSGDSRPTAVNPVLCMKEGA